MLQLKYFASLREAVGISQEEIELPDQITDISELVGWLQKRGDTWKDALGDQGLHVAINQELAQVNSGISDGDEIAWYPPVTGG